MADARKTWAQLDVLFATNSAGAISAQDLRDGFQSLEPHVAAAAPTVDDDETDGFDTDHAWIDTSTSPRSLYRCLDATTGAAVWVKVYPPEAPSPDAEDVAYDNDTSGLDAEDVQAAIDELASNKANSADLGSAAAADTGDFATAAQGGLADTAVQPGDDADTLASGDATNGYVLTADGAGGAAWEAPSGGGGGGIAPSEGLVVVQHGANAGEARPTAATVYWQGSVAPDNRQTGDLWLETGAFD